VNRLVSPDGRYLYFTTGGTEPKALRLRFADHQIETITSLKDLRRVVDLLVGATQIDVAPMVRQFLRATLAARKFTR